VRTIVYTGLLAAHWRGEASKTPSEKNEQRHQRVSGVLNVSNLESRQNTKTGEAPGTHVLEGGMRECSGACVSYTRETPCGGHEWQKRCDGGARCGERSTRTDTGAGAGGNADGGEVRPSASGKTTPLRASSEAAPSWQLGESALSMRDTAPVRRAPPPPPLPSPSISASGEVGAEWGPASSARPPPREAA
jgi:hypothetical protein